MRFHGKVTVIFFIYIYKMMVLWYNRLSHLANETLCIWVPGFYSCLHFQFEILLMYTPGDSKWFLNYWTSDTLLGNQNYWLVTASWPRLRCYRPLTYAQVGYKIDISFYATLPFKEIKQIMYIIIYTDPYIVIDP